MISICGFAPLFGDGDIANTGVKLPGRISKKSVHFKKIPIRFHHRQNQASGEQFNGCRTLSRP